MVQPPWCEVVEPDPNVPRERPDHPAPTRSNRNAEEHQQDPRCLLLALGLTGHQEQKKKNACALRRFYEFLPAWLALTKGEGFTHTSWGNGEPTRVAGAMNWK